MPVVVWEHQGARRRHRLLGGRSSIGRHPECDIHIDDRRLNRFHAHFVLTLDGLWIEDMGSASGVWVNAQRAVPPQALRAGDVVGVGGVAVAVEAHVDDDALIKGLGLEQARALDAIIERYRPLERMRDRNPARGLVGLEWTLTKAALAHGHDGLVSLVPLVTRADRCGFVDGFGLVRATHLGVGGVDVEAYAVVDGAWERVTGWEALHPLLARAMPALDATDVDPRLLEAIDAVVGDVIATPERATATMLDDERWEPPHREGNVVVVVVAGYDGRVARLAVDVESYGVQREDLGRRLDGD